MKLILIAFIFVGCSHNKNAELNKKFMEGFSHGLYRGCSDAMYSVWVKPLDDKATMELAEFERKKHSCLVHMNKFVEWANQQ